MSIPRSLASLLLIALSAWPAAAEDEGEPPAGAEARDAAEALLEADRPREALSLFERAIETGQDAPAVRVAAARCAFEAGLYARAVKLARVGNEALKKIQPVTDEVRLMRARFQKVEKEASFERHLRDKLVGKIVGDVIRDLPHDTLIRKSRYLTENKHDGLGNAGQRLRDDYTGRHLGIRIERSEPRWYARIAVVEQYADAHRAQKRFDEIMKVIKAQRAKWERVFRDRRKTRGFKLTTVPSRGGARVEGERLEHRRTTYRWKAKNQPNLEHNAMAVLVLSQPVLPGESEPPEETWYTVSLSLDGSFFTFRR